MRYSIEGQELTDMADELRAIYGETETIKVIEQQPIPLHEILNTNDATDHDNFGFVFSSFSEFCPIQIDGAKHLKVIITVVQGTTNDSVQIVAGKYQTTSLFPWNSEEKVRIDNSVYKEEYTFLNTDVITIYAYFKGNTVQRSGLYAEIIALDDSGEPIPSDDFQDVEVEKEVKRTYKSSEIAEAISGLDKGLPEEVFLITGDCNYRFYKGNWDWFIDRYGDKITTSDISDASNMFSITEITKIPFEINMQTNVAKCASLLSSGRNINVAPTIKLNLVSPSYSDINFSSMLYACAHLRDAEHVLDPNALEILSTIKVTSSYSCPKYNSIIDSCSSLRNIPSWWYKLKISEESTAHPAGSYSLYYNGFSSCFVLNELNNLTVQEIVGEMTAQMFNRTFAQCSRAKNITFETNEDGTPKVVKWKTQTIDASNYLGYANSTALILNYNSGITINKQVTNDITYQALKDDPDWWTTQPEYSRYNHDSAVATINTLPDTSAYLAEKGGTNTIKFKKTCGSLTDGGAIENLTAEEIAVATAKGWTVTLS